LTNIAPKFAGGSFSGNLGIGTTSPGAKLDVAGKLLSYNDYLANFQTFDSTIENFAFRDGDATAPTWQSAHGGVVQLAWASPKVTTSGSWSATTASWTPQQYPFIEFDYRYVNSTFNAYLMVYDSTATAWRSVRWRPNDTGSDYSPVGTIWMKTNGDWHHAVIPIAEFFRNSGFATTNTITQVIIGNWINTYTAGNAIQIDNFRITATPMYNFPSFANNYVTITDSGNVGIGTTAPGAKLDITSGSNYIYAHDTGVGAANNSFLTVRGGTTGAKIAGLNLKIDSTNLWQLLTDNADANKFFIQYNNSSSNRFLTMTTNGNVGIGTTAPVQTLDIHGGAGAYPVAVGGGAQTAGIARFYSSSDIMLDIGAGNTSPWGFWMQAHNISNANAFPLLLNPNGGYVGIGTTGPAQKLHIYSNSADAISVVDVPNNELYDPITAYRIESQIVWNTGIDNNDSNKFKISNGGNWNNIGTGDKLTIDSSGNVGIGTTAPTANLDVAGNMVAAAKFADRSNTAYYLVPAAGTNSLLVAGNVGVGTTTPAAKLDVAGATSTISNASGNISVTPNANLIVTQGNVGIGTTTPAQKLAINGNLTFTVDNSIISKAPRAVHSTDPVAGCPPARAVNTNLWTQSFTLTRSSTVFISGDIIRNASGRHDLGLFLNGSSYATAITNTGSTSDWVSGHVQWTGTLAAGTYTQSIRGVSSSNVWGCGGSWGSMDALIFEN